MPPLTQSVTGRLWRRLATLAAPGLRLMLRRRVRRGKELRPRLQERRGIEPAPRPAGTLIWLHAASVGEAVSVLPVIDALLEHPAVSVLVTTGTVTSAAVLAQRCPADAYPRLLHRFVPLDVPRWIVRFLDHWRPDAAAFLESELWPNMLWACRERTIPLMLLNARMSERSEAGWARAPRFAREVVGAFDHVWAQSGGDAERLRRLGARGVCSPGNLKFAAPPLPADPDALAGLAAALQGRPVWLAASTHRGEEKIAAAVHHRLASVHPGLLTIIAPRHPERGAALAAQLAAPLRSEGREPPRGGLWIADTLGELGLLYRLCPLVFVGKSLVGEGGQNPLEPARLGCALAAGPHMENQQAAASLLAAAGALTTVADTGALARWLDAMLRDPMRAHAAGEAAARVAGSDAALPGQAAAALMAMAG